MAEIEKQLREPENWQDFETLCKKLWGEIWNCPEIKKHGTTGQPQNGVDLFGIPENEITSPSIKKYYGIQCKKKDIRKNIKIEKSEIDKEINEAKKFIPPLKKYYIATTAQKSVEIEEYVREKNIESITNGGFQIEIFFWEDIVSLIDENKNTHDWYIKNRGYKNSYDISFVFDNEEETIVLKPKFKKTITKYKLKPLPVQKDTDQDGVYKNLIKLLGIDFEQIQSNLTNPYIKAWEQENILSLLKHDPSKNIFNPPINYSRVDFSFIIKNNGSLSLENYKLYLEFSGEMKKMGVCRKGHLLSKVQHNYDAFLNDTKKATLKPMSDTLVPNDMYGFDVFYLYPNPEIYTITVSWKFLSRDYQDEGKLEIKIIPDIDEKLKTVYIQNEEEVRIEELIEDFEEER
jgi:hypothetical protein